MIRLRAVVSSAVEAVGYDAPHAELHIVFTGGRRYAHRPVPGDVLGELLEAESIGGFVNRWIKPHYPYREIPHGPARTPLPGAS